MTQFASGAISQIPTDEPTVYAFRIEGRLDDDAVEDLAEFMIDAFDRHDKLNMLLDLTGFTGSDWDTLFDWDVIKSRVRSLSHVERYAVIGAPDRAAKMIDLFDNVIPVDAQTFDPDETLQAWAFVGAAPLRRQVPAGAGQAPPPNARAARAAQANSAQQPRSDP